VQKHEPAAVWDIEFSKLELWGQCAIVSIVTKAKSAAPAYRQTLFYQRTATRWIRMEPDATQWGAERMLETPNFVYHFRQNDAQTVATVAPQIDALYITMQRNFGLPISPGGEKLMIDVSVSQPPGDALSSFTASKRFLVSSPARYLAPVAISDTDLLAQSIALPLLTYVRAQAVEHYALNSSWQPLLGGLRLWQLWEMNLPLAGWREDVVKWLYLDLSATRPGQPMVIPDRYQELCATHKPWLASPLLIKIPLLCAERKWEESLWTPGHPRHPVTRLERFALPVVSPSYEETSNVTEPRFYPGRTVVLATMVEYTVATYGRERLPVLVASLGQYESWETLIPAVYGVSPAEFEAGWQAYLAAHYSIAADIFTK
jgi:hypothetical protein